MIRRLVVGLVSLAVGLTAITGCGVPTSSEVQYVGPGPEAGSRSRDEGKAPPRPDDATTPGDLVQYFLQAAAGSPQTAADRVREFLHPNEWHMWRPDEQIQVVRLREEPFVSDHLDGGWQVELSVQVVGDLHPNGYLDITTTPEPVVYSLRVVVEGLEETVDSRSPRLRIMDPPPYLLLADTALANPDYFQPHLIYFWDTDHRTLVPDLRWLPKAGEPADQHPWTVFRWLLTGPAPGLARTEGLPAGTRHNGIPVWDGDRLVVNVNAAAVEGQDVSDLATQLAWSLLSLREGAELELLIDDRPQQVSVQPRPEYPEAVRFVLVDGTVRQYLAASSRQATPALTEELNQGLTAAALTSRGEVAALVRQVGQEQELIVVRALPSTSPRPVRTGVTGTEISPPMWLVPGANAIGLVVADQRLYWFDTRGKAHEIQVTGLAGPIQTVAISPEQRRLAIIAGDRLYLAQVVYERDTVSVLAPRALPTSLTGLTDVTFSHEQQLIVAGRRENRTGLYRLTVDGAVEHRLLDLGNATVTNLTAHPRPPAAEVPVLMYEADGRAHSFTGAPTLIRPDDLIDPPEEAVSPPYAPFFLR